MTTGTGDSLPAQWIEDYWAANDLGDPGGFLAMSSMFRLHQIMRGTVEAELRRFGLGVTDYFLLVSLAVEADKKALLGRLARALMVHATTVTFAVERLETRGLLTRAAHPTDRRATQVIILPPGEELVRDATLALRGAGFGLPDATRDTVGRLHPLIAELRDAAGDTPR